MKKSIFLFLFFISIGCSPSTVTDCRREAKGVIKSLTADLKEIQTREDLLDKEEKISRKVQILVDLMIRLKKLQERGAVIPDEEDHTDSDDLMQEMKRIYTIEGGRVIFERFEREALLTLDAYDQRRKK
ncbi:hypothetical protein [Simkania negevensis]|uniref:Lipoprotein n=1 Tax=Simkania negevensis (strain ATCC VR-1471 / DSM 27360 / Z) TaxID=331113 RepID=F8L6W9_SIMNZ|nr:hypothetical protein [Simkania negevensis]MCB1067020.1 hypothetical protein [Simkania sp.]MCB1075301.1 hypothetical protein [Simkania sp.]CCB88475.1 putative uncharacterized protein [Simkania negevensis Z]